MATTRAVVVGVFDDKERAERAVSDLRDAGFDNDQIGVAARDKEVAQDVKRGTDEGGETYAEEGAGWGAVGGGVVGALWGIGVTAAAVPAIGPVIAGGALAAVLASAATGAAVGAVAGALIGWGVPEEEARHYEEELRAGRILVAVKAGNRFDDALRILQNHGARTADYAAQRR